MNNFIRILLGLTDLNLASNPNKEQHFSETNYADTVTWNLLLTYATNCKNVAIQCLITVPKRSFIKGHAVPSSFKTLNPKTKISMQEVWTHVHCATQRH